MEEPSITAVHNQPEKSNKTSLKMTIGRPCGGGGAIGVSIIILGGAVAAAAFLFNQRRRKSGSSSNGKNGSSSEPAKVIQDKYINEDKGLQFAATSSSAKDHDDDQDHQQLRNESSSNGVHDQKQDCDIMISDDTSFFKQDEKGKGKLEVNGKNEDILFISPQVLDHIQQEFQTTFPENESMTQEIACVEEENVNGQDKVNGCVENASDIQVAVEGNNGKDEEINAEEQEKGEEDKPCTKSSSVNEDNGINSEALEATDKFQMPEEEENLKPLPISEAVGVAEEVVAHGETEGEEETEMNGEQIQETMEKDKVPNVDHPEPHMDTIETSLKDFQDDDSAIDEIIPMENNVNVPAIQQSAEIGELEKENVESEVENEDRVVEIEDSSIQLDDEDMITLKEDDNNDMDESSTSEIVEESSEGTADSSAESSAEPIWPAESLQCLPTESEKTEANDSKEIVELPDEEEKEEKLADIATRETRLQNSKDEKGTVLEKCMMQLGELALEATHPHKRRMLILTIMASAGSLCLYFGMDFLQLCLIFVLSMMLFEMQGI